MRFLIFSLRRAGNCDIWRSHFAVTFPFNPFPVLTHWPVDSNVFLNSEPQISASNPQRSGVSLAQEKQTESSRAPPKGKLCCFRSAANKDSGIEERWSLRIGEKQHIAQTSLNKLGSFLLFCVEYERYILLIGIHSIRLYTQLSWFI